MSWGIKMCQNKEWLLSLFSYRSFPEKWFLMSSNWKDVNELVCPKFASLPIFKTLFIFIHPAWSLNIPRNMPTPKHHSSRLWRWFLQSPLRCRTTALLGFSLPRSTRHQTHLSLLLQLKHTRERTRHAHTAHFTCFHTNELKHYRMFTEVWLLQLSSEIPFYGAGTKTNTLRADYWQMYTGLSFVFCLFTLTGGRPCVCVCV